MNSINPTEASVHAKQSPSQNTSAKKYTYHNHDRYQFVDADEIKKDVSFVRLLQHDEHKVQRIGKDIKCRCPFHDDNNPSFTIYDDSRAKCYGCDWWGDVITYVMKSHRLAFVSALQWMAKRSGSIGKDHGALQDLGAASRSSSGIGRKTSAADIQKYVHRLLTDEWIQTRVCQRRYEYNREKWSPETIRKLAEEGSLGWAGDALAFVYPKGVKYRKWPEKEFFWECEGPSLWRQHRLKAANHVFLTESESDAINALDSGVEKDESVAVIAISGANGFNGDWAVRFKGKAVTLSFDNDAAGQNAVKEVSGLLRQYATEIRAVSFKEVQS